MLYFLALCYIVRKDKQGKMFELLNFGNNQDNTKDNCTHYNLVLQNRQRNLYIRSDLLNLGNVRGNIEYR